MTWEVIRIEKELRINRRIKVKEVRLIDSTGNHIGVVPIERALFLAEEEGLDLVEISPNTNPVVCKIMDYGKFKYEQKKKVQEAKKLQISPQIKEVKLRPKIDEHDYQIKIKQIIKFLQEGHKVKVTMSFFGREISLIDHGSVIINRIKASVQEYLAIDAEARMEGKSITMVLRGKK